MRKAILFDLDGTLLPMDTDSFVKNYLKELAPSVAQIVEPNLFLKALMTGTEAMIRNLEHDKTNEKVFEETFLSMTNLKRDDIWPTLDHFYENVFPTFSHLSQPTSLAKKVVEAALERGYRVAVATNPVFPKAAIHERLKWAGLSEVPFELVTVYEESTFTKPHPQYYQSICDKLNVLPEECIMIGNDVQEDMSASQIGIQTFLVEGCVIDRGEPKYPIDDKGSLEELYKKIVNKDGIFADCLVEEGQV